MSHESLSQSEIILSQVEAGLTRAATCKDALQVRAEGSPAVMREIEHYTTPGDSHA